MSPATTDRPSKWIIDRPDGYSPLPDLDLQGQPSIAETIAAARERLGRASLASTDQIDPTERPLTCPNAGDRVVMELHSGETYPDRCRASRCSFCLPLNARRRALAITLAGPQRMIRLSLVAGDCDDSPANVALQRIRWIRRNIKRMGRDPGEWCYTIERNPNGTGYHVHALQRGQYLPQEELQEACLRAGAGIPYINAIKRTGQWTSRYGLKGFGADGYGLKTFRPNGDPAMALKINNGRLEHHSRGFYDVDGEVLRVRDAERVAIAEMNGDSPKAFVGMLHSQVSKVLADPRLRHRLILDANRRNRDKLRAMR